VCLNVRACRSIRYPANACAPTPAPGPGFAQCGDRLVPIDPRVSVANPVGTLMYEAFLHAMCAQVSPPPN
jgi:hypothetical protein